MADISEIYGSNVSYFNDVKERAFSALERLESAALSAAFSKVTYSDITVYDPGQLDKLDISSLPSVQDVMGTIQSIRPDQFPTAPSSDELSRYKKHVWEGAQLDSIQTMLMSYVASMGMPDRAFQDAIFEADRERKQKTLQDALDLVAAQTSGRGFKYANGQTNAAMLDLMEKHQFDQENQSREITRQMTEWARQNLQFAVQQGIAVEQAHMDFAYKYSSIFREIYTTLLTSILEKYRTEVQMEMSKLEAITRAALMRTDVMKANADIASTEGRLKMEKNNLEMQQSLGKFNGYLEDAKNRAGHSINAAAAQAKAAGDMVQAVSNSVIGVIKP